MNKENKDYNDQVNLLAQEYEDRINRLINKIKNAGYRIRLDYFTEHGGLDKLELLGCGRIRVIKK